MGGGAATAIDMLISQGALARKNVTANHPQYSLIHFDLLLYSNPNDRSSILVADGLRSSRSLIFPEVAKFWFVLVCFA